MIAMGENNKYSHADRVSSQKRDKQKTKITLKLVSVIYVEGGAAGSSLTGVTALCP